MARPDTIVLTESSFFQRIALESPVDQRLRQAYAVLRQKLGL
ncbi:SIR2 family protein [Hyalangium gracile]|nr:SIR2 family protein [Hyalangium gracile]